MWHVSSETKNVHTHVGMVILIIMEVVVLTVSKCFNFQSISFLFRTCKPTTERMDTFIKSLADRSIDRFVWKDNKADCLFHIQYGGLLLLRSLSPLVSTRATPIEPSTNDRWPQRLVDSPSYNSHYSVDRKRTYHESTVPRFWIAHRMRSIDIPFPNMYSTHVYP